MIYSIQYYNFNLFISLFFSIEKLKKKLKNKNTPGTVEHWNGGFLSRKTMSIIRVYTASLRFQTTI